MKPGQLVLYILTLFIHINLCAQSKLQQNSGVDTNIVLPPAWAFGVLYGGYTNQQGTINRVSEIIKHNYPIDAYWIDSWFWSYVDQGKGPAKFIDFIGDTGSYPSRKAMWKFLQERNVKGGFWMWDCILKDGNEKVFNEFKQKGFFSNVFLNTNSWHNGSRSTAMFQNGKEEKGTLCGNIDFANPKAVIHFKQHIKPFFNEGADFIKLDRTSSLEACKAMFEVSQQFGKETKGRGFMLSHSFGIDSEAYKKYPIKWTDDTRSDWTIEKPLRNFNSWVPHVAFKENIAMFTNPALATSNIPFLANDLGGFDMGNATMPEEELYIRWMQFSMFNPITEIFSQPENPTANLAWNYSSRADTLFRYYAHWRMQLFPYIYSYAMRNRIEGKHMIDKFKNHIYQYTFGNEMLLAPVFERNATIQSIYLPVGKWFNYWTGELLDGNRVVTVEAPLAQVPLFIKAGSIIPMRNYSSSIETGSNSVLTLHIYPGSEGVFNLLEDDGISNEYLSGIYSSTSISLKNSNNKIELRINPITGQYKGMKKSRKWILQIHTNLIPRSIICNEQKLKFTVSKEARTIISEPFSSLENVKKIFEIKFRS